MSIRRTHKRGFTLVEILIVVIILGILAAIVIPQFTNASTEARENSARSLLQTLRSQLELYKLQHGDEWPTDDGTATGAWSWVRLTEKTEMDGTHPAVAPADNDFGPYLQDTPTNPLNGNSDMVVVATDAAAVADHADTVGFVFSSATGKIWATNADKDNIFQE